MARGSAKPPGEADSTAAGVSQVPKDKQPLTEDEIEEEVVEGSDVASPETMRINGEAVVLVIVALNGTQYTEYEGVQVVKGLLDQHGVNYVACELPQQFEEKYAEETTTEEEEIVQ